MKKLFLPITLLLSIAIHAQIENKQLDPVTVTGSLQPHPLSRTGRNIVSVPGSYFNQLPVQSVDELLRYLPGMEVQMRGPLGAQSDIVVRGGTFQQVLVLLDGVRINDPNTGHFNSYIPVVPSEIERIEILKGASSGIYGAEAVGGVVHILTKSFLAKRGTDKKEASLQLKAGEYNLAHGQLGGYYQKKNTVVAGGVLTNNTKGQLQRGTRGFVNAHTANVSLTQFFGERLKLSVRGAYDNRDFSAQNFYTSFLSDTAKEQVVSWWTQAQLEYNTSAHRLSLSAGYKHVTDDYRFNSAAIANDNKSSMWQLTLMDEYHHNNSTSFIGGVQTIRKMIRSNDRGDHQLQQTGLFLLMKQQFGENFTVHPAIRMEYNEKSGVEWVPQLNLSYKKNQWQWRGSIGKTIREADFTERFNNYNKAIAGNGSRMGNPELQAERSLSYEIGADYFFEKPFRVAFTVFQRQQKRMIDYFVTAYDDMPRKDNLVPGATYALAQNLSKVRTAGVELDVQGQLQWSDQKLFFGTGLLWVDSDVKDQQPSFYISSHARWMWNVFADYRFARFNIALSAIYKKRALQQAAGMDAWYGREYFIANLKLGYSLLHNRAQAFVQVDNFLDKSYADLSGVRMPGRWLLLGISVSSLKK